MTPKFYGVLWVAFAAIAVLVWLVGSMSALAVVIFGFIAFGLVFTGMMCVLPSAVSHPQEHAADPHPREAAPAETPRQAPAKAYTFRSA